MTCYLNSFKRNAEKEKFARIKDNKKHVAKQMHKENKDIIGKKMYNR